MDAGDRQVDDEVDVVEAFGEVLDRRPMQVRLCRVEVGDDECAGVDERAHAVKMRRVIRVPVEHVGGRESVAL